MVATSAVATTLAAPAAGATTLRTCRICRHAGVHATFQVREMMFGTRDAFTYFECGRCGCVQIAEPPSDLARYYPAHYYSLTPLHVPSVPRGLRQRARRAVARARDRSLVVRDGVVGRLAVRAFGESWVARDVLPYFAGRTLSQLGISDATRILDVGCGTGLLLALLHDLGFHRLHGIDAYLDADAEPRPGLHVRKAAIHELTGQWDLVMLHHSLEHMWDQHETMQAAARLLAPSGRCLVRIPTASSDVWQQYREHWVQLDAPRHFFLHSVRSLTTLAEAAGLRVDEVVYDSGAFQFWGSEQYRRDIPLRASPGAGVKPDPALFSAEDLATFQRRADVANAAGRGDQAAFFLRKA